MTFIGWRIRELREKRGLSQGDIERATGMLRAYISRVEHGHTVPSLESIERFSSAFGVPLHEMFRDGAEHPELATDKDGLFLRVLSGYVHRMEATERDLLMHVARRLAKARG